jgi:hypothetical protein
MLNSISISQRARYPSINSIASSNRRRYAVGQQAPYSIGLTPAGASNSRATRQALSRQCVHTPRSNAHSSLSLPRLPDSSFFSRAHIHAYKMPNGSRCGVTA